MGTIPFTTTSAVAAGGFIVLSVGWFDSAVNLSSVAGGGLTWTVDKQGRAAGGPGSSNAALVSAQAPSGLATSTTITATFSGTTPTARMIGGSSFLGVATSAPVDTTNGPIGVNVAAAGWATGSTTIAAGSLLIATCYAETTNTTSTPTSPSIEALDWSIGGGGVTQTTAYRIEASAGSYTVAGTFAVNVQSDTNAVAYLEAAGAAEPLVVAPRTRVSRTGMRR